MQQTNNLHNIVVYIKDEAELFRCRNIFNKNGITLNENVFTKAKASKIYFFNGKWNITNFFIYGEDDTEMNLTELEQLLKQNRDDQSK